MHLPPIKFLQKRFPLLFYMVHLLHRLYGVDAPAPAYSMLLFVTMNFGLYLPIEAVFRLQN